MTSGQYTALPYYDRPISGLWGDGTYLYATNSFSHTINRLELETGNVTEVLNGVAGQFQGPGTIWGDGTHLYLADISAIRRVSAAGFQSAPVSSRSFDLLNFGGTIITTASSSEMNVGYGQVHTNTGLSNPSGVALFQYRPLGVTVAEAAVPATPLIQKGRIYAEIKGPVNTGIAIANPNGEPATLSFSFTDANGSDFGERTTTIPAHGQIARFLNELPFSPGSSIENARSFTFTSSVPVGVIALRGYTNERADFLITTLPVAALEQTSAAPLYFPHFADGGGWNTKVVLVNPTDRTIEGMIRFAASSGLNAVPYSIAPRASLNFETQRSGTTVVSGSIEIIPNATSVTPSGVVVFSFRANGIVVSETGVPPVAPAQAFRTYVENSGLFGTPSSLESGLAIFNPSDATITVSLELFALNGQPFGTPGNLTVPARSQIPLFLTEVRGLENLAPGFEGIVRISTESPNGISVIALRGHYNERADFLVTTMPVVSESAPPSKEPLIFPHIVQAGGYSTKVVVFSGTEAQQGSVSVEFHSQSGAELPAVLK